MELSYIFKHAGRGARPGPPVFFHLPPGGVVWVGLGPLTFAPPDDDDDDCRFALSPPPRGAPRPVFRLGRRRYYAFGGGGRSNNDTVRERASTSPNHTGHDFMVFRQPRLKREEGEKNRWSVGCVVWMGTNNVVWSHY